MHVFKKRVVSKVEMLRKGIKDDIGISMSFLYDICKKNVSSSIISKIILYVCMYNN